MACSVPLLNLVGMGESDVWGTPLSEPESSSTRSFPTGSKFYNSLHIMSHIVALLPRMTAQLHQLTSLTTPHHPTNKRTCTLTWSNNCVAMTFCFSFQTASFNLFHFISHFTTEWFSVGCSLLHGIPVCHTAPIPPPSLPSCIWHGNDWIYCAAWSMICWMIPSPQVVVVVFGRCHNTMDGSKLSKLLWQDCVL